MMLADVPKLKRLLEYDFLHKMDRAESKSVQSMVIFFLKKETIYLREYIVIKIIYFTHIYNNTGD